MVAHICNPNNEEREAGGLTQMWGKHHPYHKRINKPHLVTPTFTLSTLEAEAGESLPVQDQPDLYSEFQARQSYIEKPCLIK